MKVRRVIAGLYEITVNGREFQVSHDPSMGFGYEWRAENGDEGTGEYFSHTLAGLKKTLGQQFDQRTG